METKLKISGNWNELKAKLKQKYPKLTDADLAHTPGKEEELVMRISKRLDKDEEEVSDLINEFQSKRRGKDEEEVSDVTNQFQSKRKGTESDRTERDRTDRDESESDRTERDTMDSDREEINSEQKERKKEHTKKY